MCLATHSRKRNIKKCHPADACVCSCSSSRTPYYFQEFTRAQHYVLLSGIRKAVIAKRYMLRAAGQQTILSHICIRFMCSPPRFSRTTLSYYSQNWVANRSYGLFYLLQSYPFSKKIKSHRSLDHATVSSGLKLADVKVISASAFFWQITKEAQYI
jgi:hypothetical protein